jgi:hypothetical protein
MNLPLDAWFFCFLSRDIEPDIRPHGERSVSSRIIQFDAFGIVLMDPITWHDTDMSGAETQNTEQLTRK